MKKIAVLFPGSGSQYVGMGRSLYEDYQIVKDTFKEADDILETGISKVILEGSTVKLNKVKNLLVSIYTVNVAYFRVFAQETGVIPLFMAGHSLGEYSALACSGAFSFAQGLKIVKYRSDLAEYILNMNGGTMTILKNIDPATVLRFCEKTSTGENPVGIACFNSPKQVLISGTEEAVRSVEKLVLESFEKPEIINLVASPPYHSKIMENKAEELKAGLQSLHWGNMNTTVISNFNAMPYRSTDEMIDNLTLQLCHPVQWQKSIEYMISKGVDLFIEMGPQNILKNLVEEISASKEAYSFDEKMERAQIISSVNVKNQEKEKIEKLRNQRLKAISMCLTHAVSTRNNNESGEYAKESLALYEEIKQLKTSLENSQKEITDQHVREAFKMLKSFFTTKITPLKEQEARFSDIILKNELTVDILQTLDIGH